jgi:ribosomal protein L29
MVGTTEAMVGIMEFQRARLVVASPPPVVFGYVSELTNLATWHWQIGSVSSPSRKPKVGTSFAVRSRFGVPGTVTITAFEPGRRISFRMAIKDSATEEDFLVVPSDGGTTILYGILPERNSESVMLRMLGRREPKRAREALISLRNLLEADDATLDARSRMSFLQQEIEDSYADIRRTSRGKRVWGTIAISLILVALGSVGYTIVAKDQSLLFFAVGCAIYSLLPIAAWLGNSTSETSLEVRRLETQIELEDPDVAPIERRAQRLFRLHQAELDKYYIQARRQSLWAFVIGAACIALGFGVVSFAIWAFVARDLSFEAKIAVGFLGAIGGILANFVGAIALRMFSDSIRSLNELHNRLVSTHHLHFGNFLAAKIATPELRDKTIAHMAERVSELPKGLSSSPTTSKTQNKHKPGVISATRRRSAASVLDKSAPSL